MQGLPRIIASAVSCAVRGAINSASQLVALANASSGRRHTVLRIHANLLCAVSQWERTGKLANTYEYSTSYTVTVQRSYQRTLSELHGLTRRALG